MKKEVFASLKTFGKFVLWTAIGAVVTAVGSNLTAVLTNFHIPASWMPYVATAIGGALKSWATYATTKANVFK